MITDTIYDSYLDMQSNRTSFFTFENTHSIALNFSFQVPRHKSDGQNNRLKRLIFQNPLTDLSIENSRFVDETLGSEMQNYMNNLQEKILKIGVVKVFHLLHIHF